MVPGSLGLLSIAPSSSPWLSSDTDQLAFLNAMFNYLVCFNMFLRQLMLLFIDCYYDWDLLLALYNREQQPPYT